MKMSKTVFVSLPMADKTAKEINDRQDEAIAKLEELYPEETFEILDTFIEEDPDEKVKHDGAWFLGTSIFLMSYADLVYFVKGWDDARGCIMEHTVAVAYGIPIVEE